MKKLFNGYVLMCVLLLCGCSDSPPRVVETPVVSETSAPADEVKSTYTITITAQSVTMDLTNATMECAINVTISNRLLVITSDRVTVKSSATNEAEFVRAEGNTRLRVPTIEASAHMATYWPAEERVLLEQNVAILQPNRSVSADAMEFRRHDGAFHVATGEGHVRVSFPAQPKKENQTKQFIHADNRHFWEAGIPEPERSQSR
jgi:lipopolysaccharide transport protein LptA